MTNGEFDKDEIEFGATCCESAWRELALAKNGLEFDPEPIGHAHDLFLALENGFNLNEEHISGSDLPTYSLRIICGNRVKASDIIVGRQILLKLLQNERPIDWEFIKTMDTLKALVRCFMGHFQSMAS